MIRNYTLNVKQYYTKYVYNSLSSLGLTCMKEDSEWEGREGGASVFKSPLILISWHPFLKIIFYFINNYQFSFFDFVCPILENNTITVLNSKWFSARLRPPPPPHAPHVYDVVREIVISRSNNSQPPPPLPITSLQLQTPTTITTPLGSSVNYQIYLDPYCLSSPSIDGHLKERILELVMIWNKLTWCVEMIIAPTGA